jgi:hypothetical protein
MEQLFPDSGGEDSDSGNDSGSDDVPLAPVECDSGPGSTSGAPHDYDEQEYEVLTTDQVRILLLLLTGHARQQANLNIGNGDYITTIDFPLVNMFFFLWVACSNFYCVHSSLGGIYNAKYVLRSATKCVAHFALRIYHTPLYLCKLEVTYMW